jgi:tyrosyl-tRNA synthetase
MELNDLAKDLEARGLIEHASADIQTVLGTPRTVYLGVDPSADSMQAGNLVLVLLMKRLADAGHKIILLVGGGTGMIGDPKEKGERPLADVSVVENNKKALKEQMQTILGREITVVDNADWLLKVGLVEFLRDVGKHFTINEMIKRDIIKRRLDNPDDSISYTEFAYSLLQGYDYLVLNKEHGCDLQIGGSDQWINILSGVELIRRKEAKEAFAVTTPLVTDANGKKFGKSEGNAIWLSAVKTSPFTFYQFWFNQPDDVVETYLKYYTFMTVDEINALVTRHRDHPEQREAQQILAQQVTELVHGTEKTQQAIRVSQVLFREFLPSDLNKEEFSLLINNAPHLEIATTSIQNGFMVIDALVQAGLATSKTEARKLIQGNGISLNRVQINDISRKIEESDMKGSVALLKRGKQICILVQK